jgi:alkylation response protein AidB-like acyl-CoA dehydrogenase
MPIPYQAPLDELRFSLQLHAALDELLALPVYRDFSPELVASVLEEAAHFAHDVLSPLNASGGREGCRFAQGAVTTPKGFADAYRAFIAAGWNGAGVAAEHGGQGLPFAVSAALGEMWHGANMAFGLAPMLTQGAIELLSQVGSPSLQAFYLPKLISGEWTGTMCMTEPQAGSDVGAVRTRAEKLPPAPAREGWPEGALYRLRGSKIFITWGEHDLAGNIVHMVLARLPGAPEGTKGLSLFLVPKFLPGGARNDVHCSMIEHKMGLAASPTCTMQFGDGDGALGWLVGEENRGIQGMFRMMNAARFAVGLEGVGIAAYALQLAEGYAAGRVQGQIGGEPAVIARHPDVARMLMTLRAHSEGIRALALFAASCMDRARHAPEDAVRQAAQERLDLLIPVVKAHATNIAFDLTSTAIQVAGGAGYIEETGFARLLRDVRVAMIYEGTNGIQALDLAQRKLPMRDYSVVHGLLSEIWQYAVTLSREGDAALAAMGAALQQGAQQLDEATIYMQQARGDGLMDARAMARLQAAATPYLSLFGTVLEAYFHVKAAQAAGDPALQGVYSEAFLAQKRRTADFFLRQCLPEASSLRMQVLNSDWA